MKNALEALDMDLAPDRISHSEGHCFIYSVKNLGSYDEINLFENDERLGPVNNDHALIRNSGGGIFSPWGDFLYFSSSDGSNPITNGKQYRLTARVVPEEEKTLKMPRTIHLNLTELCNLRCRICKPEDFNPATFCASLSKEVIDNVISESFDSLTQLRLDSAGELFLAKHLPYVLQEATKRKIQVFISTNGTLLTEQRAELLCNSSVSNMQISLDSPDKDTLEWIRKGAKFEDVIRGAENIVSVRKRMNKTRPHIEFHAALLKQNLEHLPDLLRLAKKIGVDGVGVAYGYTHAYMDPEWSVFWMQERCNQILAGARVLAGQLGLSFTAPSSFNADIYTVATPTRYCHYLFEWSYIQPTGKVYPCCIGNYEMGDLKASSFSDIWYGDKYNELRKTYNTAAPSYAKCATCYITAVWNPDDYKAHFHPDHWGYITNKLGSLPEKEHKYCVYGKYVFPGYLTEQIKDIAALQSKGGIEAAIDLIRQTVMRHSNAVDLHNLFAEALIRSGDHEQAGAVLENLLRYEPQNCNALNNFSVIAGNKGDFKRALEILRKVLAIEPANKDAHDNMKNLRERIESLQRV